MNTAPCHYRQWGLMVMAQKKAPDSEKGERDELQGADSRTAHPGNG